MTSFEVFPVGVVSSSLIDPACAPKQGDEGAPQALLIFWEGMPPALKDLKAGDEIVILTWLHSARRDCLTVHPRDDPAAPLQGVFSTRSADRPNPVGLHQTTIVAVDGTSIWVQNLEAVDGTPVIDVKPVLDVRQNSATTKR